MDRTRAFKFADLPVEHVDIDHKALNSIKDRAHKIWTETKCPNANLIMLQALKDYMESKGAKANFSVIMEVKK